MRFASWIRSFYAYLANLDIDPASKKDQGNKKLLNIYCLLWQHTTLVFLVSNLVFTPHLRYAIAQHTLALIVMTGIQYLNIKEYFRWSKFLFLAFSFTQLMIFSCITKPGELAELFIVTVPMAAVVIYKEFRVHLLVFVISLLGTLASHFVNISHEIRTLLTLISGYARRLIGPTSTGPNSDYARGIIEQSAAIKHLVDSIIDLSKLDEKKLTLNKTAVNLSRLLRKIHSEFNDTFAQEGRALLLDLPNESFTVICDSVLMNRAITNLITNALKFTCPGGSARLSMRQDEADKVRVEVYNPGIGIPPDD